jgi:hypothetical protein
MVFPFHAEKQIGTIGRLGDSEQLAMNPGGLPFLDAGDEGVERVARLLGAQDLKLAAATGWDEVIEADALDFLGLDEVEDAFDVGNRVAGEREAQSGFLADLMAGSEAFDGSLEGPSLRRNSSCTWPMPSSEMPT